MLGMIRQTNYILFLVYKVPQTDLSVGALTVLYKGPCLAAPVMEPGSILACNLHYLVTPTDVFLEGHNERHSWTLYLIDYIAYGFHF
jgi:hypothetical protein